MLDFRTGTQHTFISYGTQALQSYNLLQVTYNDGIV